MDVGSPSLVLIALVLILSVITSSVLLSVILCIALSPKRLVYHTLLSARSSIKTRQNEDMSPFWI
ncbi:hypothetical protein AAVH_12245 [Aphelenchoides avenae]|nr:hypothetical protein AAVH_12245 [Aphelenchus avenae]